MQAAIATPPRAFMGASSQMRILRRRVPAARPALVRAREEDQRGFWRESFVRGLTPLWSVTTAFAEQASPPERLRNRLHRPRGPRPGSDPGLGPTVLGGGLPAARVALVRAGE